MTFGGMLLNTQYHGLLLVLAVLPVREAATWAAAPEEGALAPAPACGKQIRSA